MGNLHAQEFAAAVNDGQISLEAALEYHLTANHFPPISPAFIPVAKEAIVRTSEAYHNGGTHAALNHHLKLPNGKQLPVREIIEGLHLEAFVNFDGEEN